MYVDIVFSLCNKLAFFHSQQALDSNILFRHSQVRCSHPHFAFLCIEKHSDNYPQILVENINMVSKSWHAIRKHLARTAAKIM